jgi:hypothetical protein
MFQDEMVSHIAVTIPYEHPAVIDRYPIILEFLQGLPFTVTLSPLTLFLNSGPYRPWSG